MHCIIRPVLVTSWTLLRPLEPKSVKKVLPYITMIVGMWSLLLVIFQILTNFQLFLGTVVKHTIYEQVLPSIYLIFNDYKKKVKHELPYSFPETLFSVTKFIF